MARDIPKYSRGQVLRANDWNKVASEVARLGRIRAMPPLEVQSTDAGISLRFVDNQGFWAQLTEEDMGAFAWMEQVTKADGTFEDKEDGRFGTTTDSPALEINGATGLDLPMYVWLRPGWQHSPGDGSDFTGHEYLFTGAKGAFAAKLTAFGDDGDGNTAWSWTEQQPAVNGTWEDKPDGMTGVFDGSKPAYERNGFRGIPIDSVVWLHPGFTHATDPPGQEYEFGYEQDHFPARISAEVGSGVYTVVEQQPPRTDLTGGRTLNAGEYNLTTALPIGLAVEVFVYGVPGSYEYWFTVGANPPPIRARLTAFGDDGTGRVAFSWNEVTATAHGGWADVMGGHSGVFNGSNPAYERNGYIPPTGSGVGSIVWLYHGYADTEWVFDFEVDHFPAILGTEVSDGVYEFAETYPPQTPLAGGRSGDAAEYNGITGIPEGTAVEIFVFGTLGTGFEYWFSLANINNFFLINFGGTSTANSPIAAIITDMVLVSGQPRYSWVQAQEIGLGGWDTLAGGLSGTLNAFERNQFAYIPAGAVVWLYKGQKSGGTQTWLFDYEQDHFPAQIATNNSDDTYDIEPLWPLPSDPAGDFPLLQAKEYNLNRDIRPGQIVNVFRYEKNDGGLEYWFYAIKITTSLDDLTDENDPSAPDYDDSYLITAHAPTFKFSTSNLRLDWGDQLIQPVGPENEPGDSEQAPRADHVHKCGNTDSVRYVDNVVCNEDGTITVTYRFMLFENGCYITNVSD